MANGDGKVAEKKVMTFLKDSMAVDPLWWGHRLPDAAVCMGRLPKQPADFMVVYAGSPMLLEVKESKSETSIPKSRLTQSPKMRRFNMAGGSSGFLFLFPYAKKPYWCFAPTDEVIKAEKGFKINHQKFYNICEVMEHIKSTCLLRSLNEEM